MQIDNQLSSWNGLCEVQAIFKRYERINIAMNNQRRCLDLIQLLRNVMPAAGAVRVEAWWARSGLVLAATALTTALILPVVLPIQPASTLSVSQATSPLGEEVGWPDMVDTVATVWFSLPATQRVNAVILTFDYSQAGAINELGLGLGLPTAVSAHNTEWFWGPGNPNATTVVAWYPGSVDMTSDEVVADLSHYFLHVRVAATISNSCPGYLDYPFQNKRFGHGLHVHFSYLLRLIFSKVLIF
jgi:hypothetical protein